LSTSWEIFLPTPNKLAIFFVDFYLNCQYQLNQNSGAHIEPKREPRVIRGRARRCNRGRKPTLCHCLFLNRWEGAVSRMIRKSEDLPE
jgi:hypothetical protein